MDPTRSAGAIGKASGVAQEPTASVHALPELAATTFVVSIEVLPPRNDDTGKIVAAFGNLAPGLAQFLNVADSPMARPRLSPTILAGRLQSEIGLDAIVHLTVRDRNRIALESEILGAKALGVRHHLCVSGDPVIFCDRGNATAVSDLTVPDLVRLCKGLGQVAGVVFDVSEGVRERELRKMASKVEAGADFIITQPIYEEAHASEVAAGLEIFGLPALMGILPLYSARHTEFLHTKVPGIHIPEGIRQRMASVQDETVEGVRIARELLPMARGHFQGACLMPPFGHYELAAEILSA
jgi:methylenetetrahydrofolate reductase (NADPH)